jgi:hypothetical protein
MLWPMVCRPVYLGIKHPSAAHDQIFITSRQWRVCWCGALPLTRGQVCRLQLLRVLASAVIFGSESRGTRDHILLFQIRDFTFLRLLRLAGLRWRYSTCKSHLFQQYSNCALSRYCALNGSLPWISTFNQLKLHCVCQNPKFYSWLWYFGNLFTEPWSSYTSYNIFSFTVHHFALLVHQYDPSTSFDKRKTEPIFNRFRMAAIYAFLHKCTRVGGLFITCLERNIEVIR